MRMGSAWIQTSGPQLLSTFSCGVSSWPSSSYAEVIAIFTALLTAPSQCRVKINTDSQTCIDTFKYIMTRSLTTRQWLRINNHVVWLKILETVKSKSLSVILFKVKAHSGVNFNKQVDRLAKNALNLEPIQFNIIDTGPLFTIPTWDIFSVNINTRNFIKQIHKYINLYTWKSQNRIKKFLTDDPSDQSNSDWKLAWKRLSIRNYYTSIKQSNKRTFLFKLIHNELPTLDRLAIRQPKIYSSFTMCPLCHSTEENIEHLFLCPQTDSQRSQLWNNAISYATFSLQKSLENNHRHPIIEDNLHTTITSIANNIISNTSFLIKFTSGFIQPNYISTIKQVTAEKQHGIINRMKRKLAHIIQIDSNESNNSSNCNNNSNNINNSFNNDSNNNYNNNNNNCINNSFNIIKGWVSKVAFLSSFSSTTNDAVGSVLGLVHLDVLDVLGVVYTCHQNY
ncbi:hypothetical protein Glove_366g29 [Diversispora epigaea]|uniref:RNase H type-1 domain-containing protein n=1 Tax=Diversispora epigaea TaxID=1348612 RepID=A0A397HBM9_9GLOM|nr:hypothetical protein Glove_366g29 [Diversispora epigaea]